MKKLIVCCTGLVFAALVISGEYELVRKTLLNRPY